MALTPKKKYELARRWRNCANAIDRLKKEQETIGDLLLSHVSETGDRDFLWEDVKLTYIPQGEDSTMLDSKKVELLYPEVYNNCLKAKKGAKAHFRRQYFIRRGKIIIPRLNLCPTRDRKERIMSIFTTISLYGLNVKAAHTAYRAVMNALPTQGSINLDGPGAILLRDISGGLEYFADGDNSSLSPEELWFLYARWALEGARTRGQSWREAREYLGLLAHAGCDWEVR